MFLSHSPREGSVCVVSFFFSVCFVALIVFACVDSSFVCVGSPVFVASIWAVAVGGGGDGVGCRTAARR